MGIFTLFILNYICKYVNCNFNYFIITTTYVTQATSSYARLLCARDFVCLHTKFQVADGDKLNYVHIRVT